MDDDRPSILERWKKDADIPERDPVREAKAKAFTDAVMKRIHAQLDNRTLPAVRFSARADAMEIAYDAARWFLPAALREFFDFETKRRDLRELRNQVKNDRHLNTADRNGKLRAIERRIAGINQFEMGFDALMSVGTRSGGAIKDDAEEMNKVASSLVSMLPLLEEATVYLDLHFYQVGEDGFTETDLMAQLRLPHARPEPRRT